MFTKASVRGSKNVREAKRREGLDGPHIKLTFQRTTDGRKKNEDRVGEQTEEVERMGATRSRLRSKRRSSRERMMRWKMEIVMGKHK